MKKNSERNFGRKRGQEGDLKRNYNDRKEVRYFAKNFGRLCVTRLRRHYLQTDGTIECDLIGESRVRLPFMAVGKASAVAKIRPLGWH
jgi:hypothetical protein